MPACPAGSVPQQVMQQYSYLFQMAQQLNLALERLEQGTGASSGGKGTEQQYRKLRSLIAGGEERLKRAVEELAAQVETEYVAADSFDGQAAALSGRLEAEPEKLGAYYGFAATLRNGLTAVADAFDRYRENAAACVRTGVVGYDGTAPVYGTAVGFGLACRDADGETEVEPNGFRAVFTGEELSLRQDAQEVARVADGRLHVNGTAAEDGAYLKVTGTASCASVGGRNTVQVRVRWRPAGGSWSGYTTLVNGAETVVGGGLAADTAYEAEVSAADTVGGVRTVRQLLPPVSPVTLHLHSGGRGAAFGKRSTGEALECAWPAVFYGDVEVSGGLTLGGQALADALWPVGCVRLTAEDTEPQPSPEGAEWERVDCGMAGIYAWRRIT